MDESKDREGSRGLVRGRSMANRSSPAARQQPMGSSSPTVSNDYGDCSLGDGVDGSVPMDRRKKEMVSASRWKASNKDASGDTGSSESEEVGLGSFQPMLNTISITSLPSRQKERLRGKVAEENDAVDLALVPRKLRSAMNTRSRGPLSLTIPNAKKKHYRTSNRLQGLPNSGGREGKQNGLLEAFTKDEELVIEALCELSRMLPIGEQIAYKEDSKALDRHQVYLANCSKGSKVDKNLLHQSLPNENTSSCMEKPLEDAKNEVHAPEQSMEVGQRETVDSDLNITPELILTENEPPENTPSTAFMKFSSHPGVLLRCCTEDRDRVIQPGQADATETHSSCKYEVQQNGCVKSTTLRNEVQQVECDNGSIVKCAHDVATPSNIQQSSNSTVWPGPVSSITGLSSRVIELPTEKVPLTAMSTWKKCAIHVFIGHNIKSYQDKERQRKLLLTCDESKQSEYTKSCGPANNVRVGSQSGLSGRASASISVLERNKNEERNGIFCNSSLMQTHQYSGLVDAKQKQAYDFLSLSAGGDTVSPVDGAKSAAQLHSPYLHTHPHHSLVPFPFPNFPYPLPYSEKLVPVAAQQVQLQVPHFIGNQFYRHQIDNTISNIQLQQYQQQQLWQAHYANYCPPAGIGVPQNERLHDSSAPPVQSARTSILSPPLSVQMQGGSYHPILVRQHRQLIANASSSSANVKSHKN
ncbi:uncharacterized protein LOC122037974 isoform X2 [Zingiber officinale]|uniref:uncharacterized protein LOC122037974 isoform X2 n=1 Tax=Zingiber officinale TaxID=94328 RepID=UPI001C4DAE9C|nr:uncharacterized protein LOC122037974 isoform X2 [Zingiber officinale]XP_042453419.1 uncharacterized protein LOC122037974 isoform X2 [Zingiber officinale]